MRQGHKFACRGAYSLFRHTLPGNRYCDRERERESEGGAQFAAYLCPLRTYTLLAFENENACLPISKFRHSILVVRSIFYGLVPETTPYLVPLIFGECFPQTLFLDKDYETLPHLDLSIVWPNRT